MLALLRERQSQRVILAACTHLYHDPRFPDVKVAEAELLCGQACPSGTCTSAVSTVLRGLEISSVHFQREVSSQITRPTCRDMTVGKQTAFLTEGC